MKAALEWCGEQSRHRRLFSAFHGSDYHARQYWSDGDFYANSTRRAFMAKVNAHTDEVDHVDRSVLISRPTDDQLEFRSGFAQDQPTSTVFR